MYEQYVALKISHIYEKEIDYYPCYDQSGQCPCTAIKISNFGIPEAAAMLRMIK